MAECDRLLESARDIFAPLICASITAKASLLAIQEIIYCPSLDDFENVTITFDYREDTGAIHNASVKLRGSLVRCHIVQIMCEKGRSYGAEEFRKVFEDESSKGMFFLDKEVCLRGRYASLTIEERGKI